MREIERLQFRIRELEAEVEALRNRNFGGRKKQDNKWKASYNEFVKKLEAGMSINDIVAEGRISRSTAYRYKAFYKSTREKEED